MSLKPYREQAAGGSLREGLVKIIRELLSEILIKEDVRSCKRWALFKRESM